MTVVHESTHATRGEAMRSILGSLEGWMHDHCEVTVDLVDVPAGGVRVVVEGRTAGRDGPLSLRGAK